MIYDMRTYTCRPGTVPLQIKLWEDHGMSAQKRHLGEPVCYGIAEVGELNTFVHIWAYTSHADREKKRAAMQADPEWQNYIRQAREADYIVAQRNQVLVAPHFMVK